MSKKLSKYGQNYYFLRETFGTFGKIYELKLFALWSKDPNQNNYTEIQRTELLRSKI